jgi:hypothetical protein
MLETQQPTTYDIQTSRTSVARGLTEQQARSRLNQLSGRYKAGELKVVPPLPERWKQSVKS